MKSISITIRLKPEEFGMLSQLHTNSSANASEVIRSLIWREAIRCGNAPAGYRVPPPGVYSEMRLGRPKEQTV